VKHAAETQEQSGCATGLENQLVGEDEEAGLGEKVGIHRIRLENRQDLAVDHVQHGDPSIGVHGLQTVGTSARRERRGTWGEPHLEELLRA
jgi:hypothetical protein